MIQSYAEDISVISYFVDSSNKAEIEILLDNHLSMNAFDAFDRTKQVSI